MRRRQCFISSALLVLLTVLITFGVIYRYPGKFGLGRWADVDLFVKKRVSTALNSKVSIFDFKPKKLGVYTVKSGDTLSKIAQRDGSDISDIWCPNPSLENPNLISVGQELNMLPNKLTDCEKIGFAVSQRETAANLASRFELPLDYIKSLNYWIKTGEQIIPYGWVVATGIGDGSLATSKSEPVVSGKKPEAPKGDLRKAAKAAAKKAMPAKRVLSPDTTFFWKELGGKPFKATVMREIRKSKKKGMSDAQILEKVRALYIKAIEVVMPDAPETVRRELARQLSESIVGVSGRQVVWKGEECALHKGQVFSGLLFKDYRVVLGKVQADWRDRNEVKAICFCEEYDGYEYHMALVNDPQGGCWNLVAWRESSPRPSIPEVPTPEPPEPLRPGSILPPSPPDEEEEIIVIIEVPGCPPAETPPVREVSPVPVRPPSEMAIELDYDLSAGAFTEHYDDGNDVAGYWMVPYLYLFNQQDGNMQYSYGVAGEINSWSGETGTDFHYSGDRWTVDGAARIRDREAHTEIIGRAGYGETAHEGFIEPSPGVRVDVSQTSPIVTGYGSYEKNWPEKRFFNKLRIYGQGDLGLGGEETNSTVTVNGLKAQIATSPEDVSSAHIGVDGNLWSSDPQNKIAVTGGVTSHYLASTSSFGAGPSLGVSLFNKGIEVKGWHTFWEEGADSWGVGAEVTLKNLYYGIKGLFASGPNYDDFDTNQNADEEIGEILNNM